MLRFLFWERFALSSPGKPTQKTGKRQFPVPSVSRFTVGRMFTDGSNVYRIPRFHSLLKSAKSGSLGCDSFCFCSIGKYRNHSGIPRKHSSGYQRRCRSCRRGFCPVRLFPVLRSVRGIGHILCPCTGP